MSVKATNSTKNTKQRVLIYCTCRVTLNVYPWYMVKLYSLCLVWIYLDLYETATIDVNFTHSNHSNNQVSAIGQCDSRCFGQCAAILFVRFSKLKKAMT